MPCQARQTISSRSYLTAVGFCTEVTLYCAPLGQYHPALSRLPAFQSCVVVTRVIKPSSITQWCEVFA